MKKTMYLLCETGRKKTQTPKTAWGNIFLLIESLDTLSECSL